MAKLTAAKRKALPTKDFAGPDRSYPVQDKSHARNALARVSEMENRGKMPKAVADGIRAKADKVLGKSSKKK